MESAKKYRWRLRAVVIGLLALVSLGVIVLLMSVNVQTARSTLTVQSVPIAQSTPTEDATVTALNKGKLIQQVQQHTQQVTDQQHTWDSWLWSSVATLLSTLVLAIAGFFTLFRYFIDQCNERGKQREEREKLVEVRQAELVKRAEERFESAVTGLGDEKEGAQVGAAILLRTFLRPGYEQFYTQTFDLIVANLRCRGTAKIIQPRSWDVSQNADTALSLTTFDQALIVVFKEAFSRARDQEKRKSSSLDATSVQLDHAYLVKADLKHLWGPKASLQKANLTGANFTGANLTGANLTGANLTGANLTLANLSGINLSGTNLTGADLTGADLTGANLTGANLTLANLSGINLSGANLSGINLSGTNLSTAKLIQTNLSGARLIQTDLSGANLTLANLTLADLSMANLSMANLSMANLSMANLTLADLRGAKGLKKERLAAYKVQGALVDEKPPSNVSQDILDQDLGYVIQ